jgi:hypothetical protein
MTVAGIAKLAMTQAMLRAHEKELDASGAPVCCGEPRVDKPLEDACRWLGNSFQVTNNPGDGRWVLYYLYGLERAGRFSGKRSFVNDRGQKRDWYREGAVYLVKTQNLVAGTWEEGQQDSIVGTSFALMFLSKGLAPVLINKLQYGPLDPNRNVVTGADWNRHPDDVRNLTQYISSRPKWPKLLNWQTVDISQATVADLLQAPILFMSGSEAPQFTAQHVALLKEYVQQGGFIFVDNCCTSQAFDEGFGNLINQMYPPAGIPQKKLTAQHPVFRSEFNLLDEKTGEPTAELWAVDVGGRTSIIYSPDNVSCLWDKWTSFEVPERPKELVPLIDKAMRVGVNVVAFVTGRKIVNKLDRPKSVEARAKTLTITIEAADNGEVASVTVGLAKLFEGRLDESRLRMLDRRLKDVFAIEGAPFDQVLLRVGKSLEFGELMKIIEICNRQKMMDGKPVSKISFVELREP